MGLTTDLKTKKVLLIDDDRLIRKSLSYYFNKRTLSFVPFENAEDALERLQGESFDIIVCDYMLPGMDGLEFFKRLEEMECRAMRILITAYPTIDIAAGAVRMGIHDFIQKPFDMKTLEGSLAALIKKSQERKPVISMDGRSLTWTGSQEQEEALEFLIGKITHQIANFLHGLQGNADLGLLEAEANNPIRLRLTRILQCAERISDLNGELKSLGKPITEQAENVNVVALVEQCVSAYAGDLYNMSIRIDRDYDEEVLVMTKPNSLAYVIDNILLNAIQALVQSTNAMKSMVLCVKRRGDAAVIEIRDTGMGMDQETLNRAFTKGFTTKPDGTGLGLFIAGSLCRYMGVLLDMESEELKGTRVRIVIPRN